jgi:hypothetical protein
VRPQRRIAAPHRNSLPQGSDGLGPARPSRASRIARSRARGADAPRMSARLWRMR